MNRIPAIGLGTWQNTNPEQCAESVRLALESGYTHADTAQFYDNERAVGEGIATASVPREDVFVATKLHPEQTGLAYDEVLDGVDDSLRRLGVDTLDLLYVHWPVGNYDAAETLPAFDELVDRGTVDHVGVSNFSPDLLDEALDVLDAPLFAHQVEMHPLLQQETLLEHARKHDYYQVAYSPLAQGGAFDVPEVARIAKRRGVSPAQVCLAWLLSKKNVTAVPKATSEAHIADNRAALDLALTSAEVESIDSIRRTERLIEQEGAPWSA